MRNVSSWLPFPSFKRTLVMTSCLPTAGQRFVFSGSMANLTLSLPSTGRVHSIFFATCMQQQSPGSYRVAGRYQNSYGVAGKHTTRPIYPILSSMEYPRGDGILCTIKTHAHDVQRNAFILVFFSYFCMYVMCQTGAGVPRNTISYDTGVEAFKVSN